MDAGDDGDGKAFRDARSESSKPRNIKYNNQKLVMSLFRWAGKLSVSEISEQVGLSKTTIKKIIGDLMKKNMLLSAGKGESTEEGGKKPELFIFNPTFRYIVLVNIPHYSCPGFHPGSQRPGSVLSDTGNRPTS